MIPGIYVEDFDRTPPAVAQVETAIPAFIGFTARAHNEQQNDLTGKPTTIFSMPDFERYFGRCGEPLFEVLLETAMPGIMPAITVKNGKERQAAMWLQVRQFFAQGGTKAILLSAGSYAQYGSGPLLNMLASLPAMPDASILVLPDAAFLPTAETILLQRAALSISFATGQYFSILDLPFAQPRQSEIMSWQTGIGTNTPDKTLSFGAAYGPYLHTSAGNITSDDTVSISHRVLAGPGGQRRNRRGKWDGALPSAVANADPGLWSAIAQAVAAQTLQIPPCGTMAGVFAQTNRNRGAWKAPANVALNNVLRPAQTINDLEQAKWTQPPTINPIRLFTGKGTLVWGARTLAGNDNEWRYVPVRRTAIMLEQSLTRGLQWVVFEPNEHNTWIRVRSTCENFLQSIWRQGGMQGATPGQAYFVAAGLGSTMTTTDLEAGRLLVHIGFAPVRPAEFIVLRLAFTMAALP